MTIIEPESVDAGDVIRVVHKRDSLGISREVVGRVHRRGDAGNFRTLYTAEGGEILTWKRPNAGSDFRVILVEKAPAEQEPLSMFNLLDR